MSIFRWLQKRLSRLGLYRRLEHHEAVSHGGADLVLPLPIEVLLTIVQQLSSDLDREQLKIFRLTARIFHRTATPILFDTLHLSANTGSLMRFARVAECPHLARNVRKVVFHRGCWAIYLEEWSDDNYRRAFGMLRSLWPQITRWSLRHRGRPVSTTTLDAEAAARLTRTFMKEVHGDLVLPHMWYRIIRKPVREGVFSTLECIDYPTMNEDRQSEYHIRMTGHVQTLDVGAPFTLWTILETAGRVDHLKKLNLHDLTIDCIWPYTKQKYITSLRSRFHRLEVLNLSFGDQGPYTVTAVWPHLGNYSLDKSYNGFHALLSACAPSLQELTIKLHRRTFSWQDPVSQSVGELILMTSAILRTFFPCLYNLSLTNFVTNSNSFLTFLSDHSSTLKTLHLTNWTMPLARSPQPLQVNGEVQFSIQYSQDSFINTFRLIPQITRLSEVKLRGTFRNVNNARIDSPWSWHATPSHSPPRTKRLLRTMLSKLESYMTHNYPFPLFVSPDLLSTPTTEGLDVGNLKIGQFVDMNFLMTKQLQLTFGHLRNFVVRRSTNERIKWLWTMDLHPDVVAGQDRSWTLVNRS